MRRTKRRRPGGSVMPPAPPVEIGVVTDPQQRRRYTWTNSLPSAIPQPCGASKIGSGWTVGRWERSFCKKHGAVRLAGWDHSEGHEQKGRRPVLIVSPERSTTLRKCLSLFRLPAAVASPAWLVLRCRWLALGLKRREWCAAIRLALWIWVLGMGGGWRLSRLRLWMRCLRGSRRSLDDSGCWAMLANKLNLQFGVMASGPGA